MHPPRTLLTIALIAAAGAVGCAHHRQNQYAYAPPLAPAVYPQPAVPDAVQSPVVSMPAMPAPMVAPPGVPPAGMAPFTPTGATVPCEPFQQGVPGMAAAGVPMNYVDGQTPPCPP